jgi:GT2 family glycosyltransferase
VNLVSIIIVNYNTFQVTCNCIQSVLRHTKKIPFEIILVDNGSTDCDSHLFLKQFPLIKLIQSTVNVGFSKGNNLGIAHASGDFILLLNSDTYFQENSLLKIINFMDSNPSISVIGCRMIYPDGGVQHTARKFRSIGWELLDSFRFLPYLLPYPKRAKKMLGKYFRCDFDTESDWLNGAFFMFGRRLLKAFPNEKLDESFFMYGEDQLWCWQIKQLGYRIFFFSQTTIVHLNNGSTDLSKRLQLRRIMLQRELSVMKIRKGKGFYYFVFAVLYFIKENIRFAVLFFYQKISGRVPR